MRYELRLYAYDVMGTIHIRLEVDGTPDDPEAPTARVLAMTANSRLEGSPEATDWTREVLDTLLHAVPER